MSRSEGYSDKGSPSSGSRFEFVMSESSKSSLKSYEEEVSGGSYDHQMCLPSDEEAGEEYRSRDRALDIVASTSHMSVVEEGVLNVHLDKNLLDSRRQLEALRESYCTPNNVGMCLVHNEEFPTDPPKGHSSKGFIECACSSEKELIVFVEKVSKKGETNTKKGKVTMLVPLDDVLFHKRACKHRVKPIPRPKSEEEVLKISASKKAEAEAIGCVAAIVAKKKSHIFLPVMEHVVQESGPSSSCKRKYKEEADSIHWNNLKLKRKLPCKSTWAQAFRQVIKPHCAQEIRLKKRKWMAILEGYHGRCIIDKYHEKIKEHRQNGEPFVLELDPRVMRSLRMVPMPMGRLSKVRIVPKMPRMAMMVMEVRRSMMFLTRYVACSSSTRITASVSKASEYGVSPIEVRYKVWYDQRTWGYNDNCTRNAESANDVLPYEIFYLCLRNGCQVFYFGSLYEVVNCNDRIAEFTFPRKH
ncbi:GRIP domain-containing protein RUD3-like [Pyrus ussuriensis x Pyrus communis]|uniref:GRIP domain-containing protein RUD3-like n=1 Tax=Pyrus ussuriensis x Pyrus communis TaxID=2448454 RepID=A0A5N5I8Y6_9ROSA|nr:GRIP domain-containing protein RUD3-like [Pyrus ussuriensis x Pyrus communis]